MRLCLWVVLLKVWHEKEGFLTLLQHHGLVGALEFSFFSSHPSCQSAWASSGIALTYEYRTGINDYSENMLKHLDEMRTSIASRLFGDLRRGSLGNYVPPQFPALGA